MTSPEPRPRLLMCPPTFFGVHYVINPWMVGNIGLAGASRARAQWDRLHALLSESAEVHLLEPTRDLPDQCFVANAGLVLRGQAVVARFYFAQRQPEVPLAEACFAALGLERLHLPDDQPFEGEGDALFQPGRALLWAAYGSRSCLHAHASVAERLRVQVESLRLVDPRFYHLDTCLCPLPGDRALYFPQAFDERSLARIRALIPPAGRLEVSAEDALAFCCNAVRVGSRLVLHEASPALRRALEEWGYEVVTTPLSELILAGGSAKCLTLWLDQELDARAERERAARTEVCDTEVQLSGHLLDRGTMTRALDTIANAGGEFRIAHFSAGLRHDQPSVARVGVSAPDHATLHDILLELQQVGATLLGTQADATLLPAPADGVAPEGFYSTTLYPTEVRVGARWVRAERQRMDVVLVVSDANGSPRVECRLFRDLVRGDAVVCGVDGVRVHARQQHSGSGHFAFMSAGVSSERRVERVVEELAWELERLRARRGRVVVVAGPVVVHTGGGRYLAELIRGGYVQALLTGNALPTHDIELDLFGTSLGVDLERGMGVPHGHQHHLRAINRVRAAGSIRAAVEQGVIRSGIVYEAVRAGTELVLAGSIRDDGPLPDTLMELCAAQAAYARALEGAKLVLMLGSMLHAIGTGNMTPAGVRLVCVDINPAVVTKLSDRGSLESVGVVTDVGLFLSLLAQRVRTRALA